MAKNELDLSSFNRLDMTLDKAHIRSMKGTEIELDHAHAINIQEKIIESMKMGKLKRIG